MLHSCYYNPNKTLTRIDKFLRPFYWKTHPSKNNEYLFSFSHEYLFKLVVS